MWAYDRNKALELLYRHNKSESLRSHALCVEAAMRHFAHLWAEDEEYWGIVGLLHDLDYEEYPEQHCAKSAELLRENGYGGDFVRAVLSHGWGICTEIEPQLRMEKVLYAVDELCGLITASVYMRPSRSVLDLEVSSLRKKFKDKRFAAGVSREVIERGAEMLGMELGALMAETIEGLREAAGQIGLKGEL